jgi:hypothetical protein
MGFIGIKNVEFKPPLERGNPDPGLAQRYSEGCSRRHKTISWLLRNLFLLVLITQPIFSCAQHLDSEETCSFGCSPVAITQETPKYLSCPPMAVSPLQGPADITTKVNSTGNEPFRVVPGEKWWCGEVFPNSDVSLFRVPHADAFAAPVIQTRTTDDRPIEWGGLMVDSTRFLLFQHAFRLATEKDARTALSGPFFRDYYQSVLSIHGWNDGDPFFVNYIDHPMEGSVAGFLEIAHDPRYSRLEFGRSSEYWKSRLRGMAFAAAFSLQFEIGPVSEASIGNIQKVSTKTGVVDWVITPVVGFGWMLGEDAIDKYWVQRWENRTDSHFKRILLRGILNPSRSFANMMQGKVPWHRDTRPGVSHF